VRPTYKVRRNDEGEAQRRRWTFYEAIKLRPLALTWASKGFRSFGVGISELFGIWNLGFGAWNLKFLSRLGVLCGNLLL